MYLSFHSRRRRIHLHISSMDAWQNFFLFFFFLLRLRVFHNLYFAIDNNKHDYIKYYYYDSMSTSEWFISISERCVIRKDFLPSLLAFLRRKKMVNEHFQAIITCRRKMIRQKRKKKKQVFLLIEDEIEQQAREREKKNMSREEARAESMSFDCVYSLKRRGKQQIESLFLWLKTT